MNMFAFQGCGDGESRIFLFRARKIQVMGARVHVLPFIGFLMPSNSQLLEGAMAIPVNLFFDCGTCAAVQAFAGLGYDCLLSKPSTQWWMTIP